jgi:Anthrax toxin LF subunit
MPKITNSDIWKVPGPAGALLERAGIHPSHGLAIQSVANDLERIVISRCATPAGIQLLDEGYSSKGFGIKAKSCDWGPFTGFAMAHIQYSKFADGSSLAAYNKQKNFFDHARSDTGFRATDVGGRAAQAGQAHSSMAASDVLKLSKTRLEYLKRYNAIHFDQVRDGARLECDSPFGRLMFILVDLKTGSSATWGLLHRDNFSLAGPNVTLADGGQWTLVRGMANTAPGGTPQDPHRRSCTGDYDLWGVFPKKNSQVASTRSLTMHGMDRQLQVFSAARPGVSQGIKARVGQLQKATMNQAVARTHHVYGKYTEDREKGNISALTLHTAREMNRRIRANGYKGGDMFHHNDDLGNPFRSDVEEDLIAFVPGEMHPHFIQSTKTGTGAHGHIGWNAWVKRYEADYVVYDNAAIHRAR